MCFVPQQEQRLQNPAPVSVQLSSPHVTHPGPTISSCKQEFKSSNHQVCESQPLEHPWNTQIIPGHWKTCKQCERGADTGSLVNTKVTLLQGELRSAARPLCHPNFLYIIILGKSLTQSTVVDTRV